MHPPRRVIAYLWAAPHTALDLIFWPLARWSGGRVHVIEGVIEVEGGAVTWLLKHATPIGGALALTLGHVILGQSEAALDVSRTHEHVHLRQYERWGPFFLPAYFACNAMAAPCGKHFYRDNPFEREAYGDDESAP